MLIFPSIFLSFLCLHSRPVMYLNESAVYLCTWRDSVILWRTPDEHARCGTCTWPHSFRDACTRTTVSRSRRLVGINEGARRPRGPTGWPVPRADRACHFRATRERKKDIWTDERRNGGGRCCVTGSWIVFPGDERAVYVILDLGREVSLCCVCGRMVRLIRGVVALTTDDKFIPSSARDHLSRIAALASPRTVDIEQKFEQACQDHRRPASAIGSSLSPACHTLRLPCLSLCSCVRALSLSLSLSLPPLRFCS